MEEQGLASQGDVAALLEEIKAMLLQGIKPEELLAQGVPEQLIMQAISELEQQAAGGAGLVPAQTAGGVDMTQGAVGLSAQGL